VLSFAASAADVLRMARIEQAGRNATGILHGFQRPQIAAHIQEIRDYLQREDAVLPNSIVIAFTHGVKVQERRGSVVEATVDLSSGAPGLVVDGQQRLSALAPIVEKDFEIFVSAIVCQNEEELRRQFILINNTRPLPKELIYELLPSVEALPPRLSARSMASSLTQRLNFDSNSSLYGKIKLHTNPLGVIASNAMQRVIMASRSHGALRVLSHSPEGDERCFQLVNDFYKAVKTVFGKDWEGMSPKTSRLLHSVGIIALGRAMEVAFQICGAQTFGAFCDVLEGIKDKTHWREGIWIFGSGENVRQRAWNELQNTPPDIQMLSDHLDRLVRQSHRARLSVQPTAAE
jgi:DGQHR domain-containing protein